MTVGDLLDGATIAGLKRTHERLLWGRPHTVSPRVLDEVFGDGGALVIITPTNQRPRYYVVAVDSAWVADLDGEFREHVDGILTAIEEEFGEVTECSDLCPDDCDGAGAAHRDREWPAADFSIGVSWGELSARELAGLSAPTDHDCNGDHAGSDGVPCVVFVPVNR